MRFDKHHIHCEIRCADRYMGWAACCDGKVGPLWERMKAMAGERKIIGWTFWVTLQRGPIEITAHGRDEGYTVVIQRAERILLAAEAVWKAEHSKNTVIREAS